MNARYNGYFYSNLYIEEVYQSLEDNYEYNFNDVLKVFPDIDSGTVQGNEEKLDDAFEKASRVIEWYKTSDWVDDSYLLIGKIRHLRAQFQYAVETFQYINQTSKDTGARQAALIALMRTYMDMGEMDKATDVSNYLTLEQKLTPENNQDYQVLLAYYHQRLGNQAGIAIALENVNGLIVNRDQRARTNFILGQIAQNNGEGQEAFDYYDLALKGNPPYELVFHSELNKMALTDYSRASAERMEKVYKTFDKMLKDGKNLEYQDKIFYVMGQMEEQRGKLLNAIANYRVGTQVEQPDTRQQGLNFLKLGEIYFDPYENYPLSSQYYDSAIAKLPKDIENYEAIVEKQEILKDFVTQLNTISLNDSLLSLSEMNPISLDAFLDQHLRAEAEKQKELEKQKRKANSLIPTVNNTNTDISEDATWYFYNQAAISQGEQEFNSTWGNRPLEDNWRRSSKTSVAAGRDPSVVASADQANTEGDESSNSSEEGFEAKKQKLLATVPKSAQQKDLANAKIQEAYFNLGRIYRFGLKREDESAVSYETLLSRYPKTDFRLETLFALYTLFENTDVSRAAEYKRLIIAEFPASLTAKVLINPNYVQEKEARNLRLQQQYADAYAKYESGNYVEADQMLKAALGSFEDADFLPTVELLSAILKAKTEGLFPYEKALEEFTLKYTEGALFDYATALIASLKPTKEVLLTERGFDFSEDFQQQHLVAITIDKSINGVDGIKALINSLNAERFPNQRLSIGNLTLKKNENVEILYINSFKTKSASERYRDVLSEVLAESIDQEDANFHNFAISIDNLQFLFDSEKIDEYLDFHEKFYR